MLSHLLEICTRMEPEVKQNVTHFYGNDAFWKTTLWCKQGSRKGNLGMEETKNENMPLGECIILPRGENQLSLDTDKIVKTNTAFYYNNLHFPPMAGIWKNG